MSSRFSGRTNGEAVLTVYYAVNAVAYVNGLYVSLTGATETTEQTVLHNNSEYDFSEKITYPPVLPNKLLSLSKVDFLLDYVSIEKLPADNDPVSGDSTITPPQASPQLLTWDSNTWGNNWK